MTLRTDTFDLGGLRLSAGEGRRLELAVAIEPLSLGGERYPVEPPLVDARLDVSRTTGDGYALRLRFDATVAGPCMRCLEPASPVFTVDAREVSQPGEGEELASPYVESRRPRPARLGAGRARARAAGDAAVPARLRRAVPGLRRRPQRRPAPTTITSANRIPAGPSCPNCGSSNLFAMAVPKQKQSHARTTQRRSQHKISAPSYNACPQCHSPRRPHRVCPVCGSYKGREVIVPDADEPSL